MPLVTACSKLTNASAQISCDVADDSPLLTYYDSTDCSGDVLNSTTYLDECLTCGAVAMTVKVVQVFAVLMWIAVA